MKKTLLIVAIVATAMVSCKKDRVCSCKDVMTQTGGPIPLGSTNDYEYTMVKIGYKTAYYHCTHKTLTETVNGVTTVIDSNCSVK